MFLWLTVATSCGFLSRLLLQNPEEVVAVHFLNSVGTVVDYKSAMKNSQKCKSVRMRCIVTHVRERVHSLSNASLIGIFEIVIDSGN